MTNLVSNTSSEARWRTYLRTVALLAPPLLVWSFAFIFLVPKLQTIWRDTGFHEPWALNSLQVALFISDHAWIFVLGVLAFLLLLEWRSNAWPGFRRLILTSTAYVLNVAVLLLFAVMLTALLMAAPALATIN
jgi:hypothetical protein